MPRPWRCSRPGWMGPWATWSRGEVGGPACGRNGGDSSPLRSLPTRAILWFCDSASSRWGRQYYIGDAYLKAQRGTQKCRLEQAGAKLSDATVLVTIRKNILQGPVASCELNYFNKNRASVKSLLENTRLGQLLGLACSFSLLAFQKSWYFFPPENTETSLFGMLFLCGSSDQNKRTGQKEKRKKNNPK